MFVMDGNFTAVHQRLKRPEDDVWLSDGWSYMAGRKDYRNHLAIAKDYIDVSAINRDG